MRKIPDDVLILTRTPLNLCLFRKKHGLGEPIEISYNQVESIKKHLEKWGFENTGKTIEGWTIFENIVKTRELDVKEFNTIKTRELDIKEFNTIKTRELEE